MLYSFDELFMIPLPSFNDVIARMFIAYGYEVRMSGFPHIPTAPFHMTVRKDGETALVRHKSWSPLHFVDLSDIMWMQVNMENYNVNIGYFLTLSDFEADAIHYAKENNIVCANQHDLRAMLQETQQISEEYGLNYRSTK